MNNHYYLYLLAAVLAIYAVRALPMTLIRRDIKSFFFALCALCDAGGDDLSGHPFRHRKYSVSCGGICDGSGAGLCGWKSVSGSYRSLRDGVSGRVFLYINFMEDAPDI